MSSFAIFYEYVLNLDSSYLELQLPDELTLLYQVRTRRISFSRGLLMAGDRHPRMGKVFPHRKVKSGNVLPAGKDSHACPGLTSAFDWALCGLG